jgi:signal recognition particle subunit SEC65
MQGEYIVYSCYFDSQNTREQGRRVPLSVAKLDPDIKDVVIALKKNKLTFQVEEKPHPAYWWRGDGRVRVRYTGSKQELLHKIAKDLVVREDQRKSHRLRLKRAKKGEEKTKMQVKGKKR